MKGIYAGASRRITLFKFLLEKLLTFVRLEIMAISHMMLSAVVVGLAFWLANTMPLFQVYIQTLQEFSLNRGNTFRNFQGTLQRFEICERQYPREKYEDVNAYPCRYIKKDFDGAKIDWDEVKDLSTFFSMQKMATVNAIRDSRHDAAYFKHLKDKIQDVRSIIKGLEDAMLDRHLCYVFTGYILGSINRNTMELQDTMTEYNVMRHRMNKESGWLCYA